MGRNSTAADYTVDEIICVCISRQINDGELIAQGIATPLVAAGYILAKLTHAPNIIFASAIGNVVSRGSTPLSLSRIEEVWLKDAMRLFGFAEAACELLPTLKIKEFFRPAQVDMHGNFNNIVIGDYSSPSLRLPGCGGIADVTTYSHRVYLYVPRHSRAVFVKEVDFVSGLGYGKAHGPCYLISDLGQFDFFGGRMRLVSYHPGVSVERIERRTGFPLDISPELCETPPPTEEEVKLLRDVIDPLGIRKLECLSGPKRREKLRQILELGG
jgi:acyl CoA:acetate/3-ketoacid CoA transferase beta subunit